MAIERGKIRPEILAQPCKRCGLVVGEGEATSLSFYRGSFVIFHEKCFHETMAEMIEGVRGVGDDG